VFRRVSVVSGVRSLSLYLVVSCCVSQLVIVICVVIIALVNKSVSNPIPRLVISHTSHP
jgi:Na+/melibiose symporter-like transporter